MAVELTESSLKIRFPYLLPGKKNSKMIVPRGRRAMLITKPEFQKIIERATQELVCGLKSTIHAGGGGTTVTLQRRSRISLLLPEDDCWELLGETVMRGYKTDDPTGYIDITLSVMDE